MRRLAALSAVVVLAAGLAMAPMHGAAAQTAHDIEVRDQLIADQENLLNAYRCLFGVDVEAVRGGCENPATVEPGPAPASPTANDVEVRDRLIADQEALLNVYRCNHDVDTQLVPGGCPDAPMGGTGEAEPEVEADPNIVPWPAEVVAVWDEMLRIEQSCNFHTTGERLAGFSAWNRAVEIICDGGSEDVALLENFAVSVYGCASTVFGLEGTSGLVGCQATNPNMQGFTGGILAFASSIVPPTDHMRWSANPLCPLSDHPDYVWVADRETQTCTREGLAVG